MVIRICLHYILFRDRTGPNVAQSPGGHLSVDFVGQTLLHIPRGSNPVCAAYLLYKNSAPHTFCAKSMYGPKIRGRLWPFDPYRVAISDQISR